MGHHPSENQTSRCTAVFFILSKNYCIFVVVTACFNQAKNSSFLLQGNLYHYWEPLAGDMHNSQEEHEEDNNDNGEGTGPDAGNEEEINWPEDEDAYSEDEERDEGNFTMSKEMEDGTKSEKPDGAAAINIDLKWSTTRQNPGIPMSDVEAQDDGSGAGCEHSA